MKKYITKAEAVVLSRKLMQAASVMKVVTGEGNNAAWQVMLQALDHAKQCEMYRHDVKRAFKLAIKEWHSYENGLLYEQIHPMFHLDDLKPETRRKFGNITDRQYYEFWTGIGAAAYVKALPFLNSLWNKYRLSLEAHKVKDAIHVAWVLTAEAAIDVAVMLYDSARTQCIEEIKLSRDYVDAYFSQFDIRRVQKAWRKALAMLSPDSRYPLSSIEEKNIDHGVCQLAECWANPYEMFEATKQSVLDYDDIFATKGFQQMVLDEISDRGNRTNITKDW